MVTPKKDIVKTPPTKKPKAKNPVKKAAPKKKKAGAPSKYHPKFDKIVLNYCKKNGATDKDIADILSVTETTINNWKIEHPKFFESIQAGKNFFDMGVLRATLVKRATGYDYQEKVYTVDKTTGKMVLTKVLQKHMPPDMKAWEIFAYNRSDGEFKKIGYEPMKVILDDINWSEVMAEFGKAIEGKYVEEL